MPGQVATAPRLPQKDMRSGTHRNINYFKIVLLHLFILCVCAQGVASLFPPFGSWELNSGHHAWQQTSYPLIRLTLPTQGNLRLNVSICTPGIFLVFPSCGLAVVCLLV